MLRAEFKPREESMLIYINGDALREACLPEIENTQFILIDDAELQRLGKAYLFKDPVVIDGKVRIDFGYGNNCEATGKRRSRDQNKRQRRLGFRMFISERVGAKWAIADDESLLLLEFQNIPGLTF